MWYVNEQRKQTEEARKKSSTKSVGTPDLGGLFHLTDHDSKECTDKDYIGKWLMIYFGFTFCPDICPDELDKLTVALHRLGKAITEMILCTSFTSLYNFLLLLFVIPYVARHSRGKLSVFSIFAQPQMYWQ